MNNQKGWVAHGISPQGHPISRRTGSYLPLSLRGAKRRGNPFSFRPLLGPGGALHRRGCGLPRAFGPRNDRKWGASPSAPGCGNFPGAFGGTAWWPFPTGASGEIRHSLIHAYLISDIFYLITRSHSIRTNDTQTCCFIPSKML